MWDFRYIALKETLGKLNSPVSCFEMQLPENLRTPMGPISLGWPGIWACLELLIIQMIDGLGFFFTVL